MTTVPLVFLDTETTGLDPVHHSIWELALVRRERDGSESEMHWFLDHDEREAQSLPEPFRSDHASRYDVTRAISSRELVQEISLWFVDRPVLVGAVPSFDTERLTRRLQIGGYRGEMLWHYHLVDVENLAAGALGIEPPWESDDLSRALGVTPPGDGVRHTAMGDVRWSMEVYDAVMSLRGGDGG